MSSESNATTATRPLESIKLDNLLINFTSEFHRIWDTKGSQSKPGAFWRPTPAPDLLPGFFPLGDVVVSGYDNINGSSVVAVVCESTAPAKDPARGNAIRPPNDFELVWTDSGSKAKKDGSIWRPIPPEGYVALGMVCSNDHEKPSLNAVRCVRVDLVIEASVSDLIWSDQGSRAKQNFSAWRIQPPTAAAGQICFAPGTFAGFNSYSKPATAVGVYSLQVEVPLQAVLLPEAPTLNDAGQPPSETPKVTHASKLPWFTVTDPDLNCAEQLGSSPFYTLERTDQYVLVGDGHNAHSKPQTFRWRAYRSQNAEKLSAFTRLTSIRFESDWPSEALPSSISFSAKLDGNFAHTEPSASEWFNAETLEIVTIIQANKTVAFYLLQSDYRLLREDGSEVATGVSYTNLSSLHMTEYPLETNCVDTQPSMRVAELSTVTDNAP